MFLVHDCTQKCNAVSIRVSPVTDVVSLCYLMTTVSVQQSQQLPKVFTIPSMPGKTGQIPPTPCRLNSFVLVLGQVELVCLLCYISNVSVSCFMLPWLPSPSPKHSNLKPRAVLFCEPLPLQEKLSLHFRKKLH